MDYMGAYARPAYMQEGIKVVDVKSEFFPGQLFKFPQPDYPMKPIDNFKLATAHKTPCWMPNATIDFQSYYMSEFLEGFVIFPWGIDEEVVYKDEFGCQWKYIVSAGGAMLDPGGKAIVDDVTKWEKLVKFPEIKLNGSDFMEKTHDPDKVFRVDIFQGLTERLVGLMGGYTEAMLALAEEPEACADFFEAFTDWEIAQIDKLYEKYPINVIIYHDDWGTERDTFFSERTMEELVLEPTRRIVQHVKSKGAAFELHSCGAIGRFMKYILDVGIDILQIQSRANDIPQMKRDFGDKICFNIYDNSLASATPTESEIVTAARKIVDTFGESGGAYTHTFMVNPEYAWVLTNELYAYSREYYDYERKA